MSKFLCHVALPNVAARIAEEDNRGGGQAAQDSEDKGCGKDNLNSDMMTSNLCWDDCLIAPERVNKDSHRRL